MVTLDHPYWRTIAFPFYTRREIAFVFSLVAIVTLAALVVASPAAAYPYAIAGYVGAAFMAHRASPARMDRPPSEEGQIIELLRWNGFSFDAQQQAWLPPLPKFLLWQHTRVMLEKDRKRVIVRGPYAFLLDLKGKLSVLNVPQPSSEA